LETFLADKPEKQAVPAHALAGDRITAVGRFNVDIDYYIASPRDTERWTMRMGQRYVDYSVSGHDYRDLLQLRLDGNGDYFVVMFPRFRDETAPQFATIGNGNVIKITGDFGTDYCFLPRDEAEVTVGDVYFRGESGSVQQRTHTTVLATASAGEVRIGQWGISAPQAASLRVETDRLIVHLPYARENSGEVTLQTSGQWKLAAVQEGVTLKAIDGGGRVVLAPGNIRAVLQKP